MVFRQHGLGETMRQLGIILAGGKSTRLFPNTLATTKQLLPVYDKPMIYYPLAMLMLVYIRDIILICNPRDVARFSELFADAKKELGVNITILPQPKPLGIADAFKIVEHDMGKDYLSQFDRHTLILGDNIFYASGFSEQLINTIAKSKDAHIFVHQVADPSQFGVAQLSSSGKVIHIEEKPKKPKSNLAITGLYSYPPDVYKKVKKLKPSARGELEITDLNKLYLNENKLVATKFKRGVVWFDAGTVDSLLETSNFIKSVQIHQNVLIGSPHEIAIDREWVNKDTLKLFLEKCYNTSYGKYLSNLLDSKIQNT